MDYNKYGLYYAKYHKCSYSLAKQNIFIFEFTSTPYETWIISRMVPPENVSIDSDKPLLLALKSFFKSDVPASVVCSRKYLWTVVLGNERVVYPVNKDVKKDSRLQFYATPYFVKSPDVVKHYLHGKIRPAYENVFFYKNTVMFLDNQDIPYPGGCYFNKCDSQEEFYRICFLSNEPVDKVVGLATEWEGRRDVMNVPYMSRNVVARPKFISFEPVSESRFAEANILSTGLIERKKSIKKPEHLIQDILNAYYKNLVRSERGLDISYLGLFIEYPFLVSYEGGKYLTRENKTFVALSINGNNPSRVLHVYQPYDRYVEYNHVPATLWTPISFVWSTLLTDTGGGIIKKVAIDTVVIGVVYRETFFCFSQPLLEGQPTPLPLLNAEYVLSTANMELNEDGNVRVIETFKYNDNFSLRRVVLRGLGLDTWCLTKSNNTDPYPKNIRLPELVKQWVEFFMEVGENTFEVDVSAVRIALMLSKHNLCYSLKAMNGPENIELSDNEVSFYFNEEVIQFINDVRLTKSDKNEDSWSCNIS